MYVKVHNRYLGLDMPVGYTAGIWHGIHSREGQVLMCHVMLETGAHWSGLPLQAISSHCCHYTAEQVSPWGAMGKQIIATHLPYLEGLKTNPPSKKLYMAGRHTGIVIDWADGYSRYPQEHKPLNLIETFNGPYILLPNNYITYTDKHFTHENKKDELKHYRRNEKTYWE